jgi:hypothetical protein
VGKKANGRGQKAEMNTAASFKLKAETAKGKKPKAVAATMQSLLY